MTKKTHQYELVSSQDNKVVATFWWDGKKVQCDSDYWKSTVDKRAPKNLDSQDGLAFLDVLPYAFTTGYMNVRNKPDEV